MCSFYVIFINKIYFHLHVFAVSIRNRHTQEDAVYGKSDLTLDTFSVISWFTFLYFSPL